MSRSYKHYPYAGDRKTSGKLHSNRKVRRYINQGGDVANGCGYKRIYEQYNICDYCSNCSFREYLDGYFLGEDGLYYRIWALRYGRPIVVGYTEKELYVQWFKSFKRK